MNQHQRKFLLETVESQYKKERDALRDREPKEPSLNNYLIAAVLDGTFVMKDQKLVRDAVRERVTSLGKGEALLGSRSRYGDDEADVSITVPAALLFELPEGYRRAREDYERAHKAWADECSALEASIGAMRLKIQIGSDKALAVLVDQADTLCSMSITTSNRLLLGGGEK
jgi:hypothetical protein